jgi:hypothetical protein
MFGCRASPCRRSSKMYKVFLDETSIGSSKKAQLARRTVRTLLEDMGYVSAFIGACGPLQSALIRVSADHIDAVGHWVGNVRREVYGCKIPKQVCFVSLRSCTFLHACLVSRQSPPWRIFMLARRTECRGQRFRFLKSWRR